MIWDENYWHMKEIAMSGPGEHSRKRKCKELRSGISLTRRSIKFTVSRASWMTGWDEMGMAGRGQFIQSIVDHVEALDYLATYM